MLLNCLQWYSIEYRTDNQWFRIGLIYPMRLIHLYLTWPKTKALPKMWLLPIQKNEAIIYKTYNINSLSYTLLPLMAWWGTAFSCYLDLVSDFLSLISLYSCMLSFIRKMFYLSIFLSGTWLEEEKVLSIPGLSCSTCCPCISKVWRQFFYGYIVNRMRQSTRQKRTRR